ncbi:MAG TPA: glycosyltransferase, partial [Sphingobacteriaceae bacterium]
NTWLHVSTDMEWRESQAFLKAPWRGVTLPNPVRVGDSAADQPAASRPVFTIGFLSRIDPKKGLDILIRALSGVSFDYRLKIAGSGEESYIGQLKQLAAECGNADKIEWTGPRYHREKFDFFRNLDLFALTSRNENFALVVIESLSVGTPVLVSREVGLAPYVHERDLGWVTGISPGAVTAGLELAWMDREKRLRVRTQSAQIVRNDFDGEPIIDQYCRFYTGLVQRGTPPSHHAEVIPLTN